MADLVIVESPAKAKTIEKYLGAGYRVKASMGHLRDLPKSKMGVNIEGGFIPDYQPIKGKDDMIKDLRKSAEESDKIYLATDPDREGEAISWHLKELLEIPEDKALRVTFNEITKNVVRDAISKPRAIDMDLVDAQQARRILDRIVGYELSPLLWRKIKRGLSAGRVQSVATRLAVDRENEIRAFVPVEYWSLDVLLSVADGHIFKAGFYGTTTEKLELSSEEETLAVQRAVEDAAFSVRSVKNGQKRRSPAPPFITSTLQQEASRKLGMQSRRAMSIAQQLYEGINIQGIGNVGLITYMRTDSLRISDEAIQSVRALVSSRYGEKYLPKEPRKYKTKSTAQDAHEAIRPSDVTLIPEDIKDSLTSDQYRLYKLIWSRFLACQMENAVYDTQAVETEAAGYIFRATSQRINFAGFTAVYEEGKDEPDEEETAKLPALSEGQALTLAELLPGQHFTIPPPRYTEASLIKAMEENGVGRPSTYAPTISTILSREYVIKEQKSLRPTPLGEVITQLMKDRFDNIIDIEFTARMEKQLDEVGEGKQEWRRLLESFYSDFEKKMEEAEEALKNERIKVPDEETDVVCELCGRNMVIKSGRFGRFLACPGYPDCKFTKAITEPTPGFCPKCGGSVLKKKSKNNYTYYGCENHPACDFMTWDIPVADQCPECGLTMFKLSGKGQKKPFCVNPECALFLPEDKRGYKKRVKTEDGETSETAGEEKKAKKTAAKKPAAKKAAAKKTAAAKKSGSKKTAAPDKTSASKSEAKKPAKRTAKKTEAGDAEG
ncbi:MAG: type I DNA topoisomerase [Oscillospiraceae bacterium]|jgi:DNA topoisomerase-1|nr:type I DNA topoisomerase [Oscillospiraceae bacterium]